MPEDDPRNPAVIADNVGDNVGDVAGMGADLFESYVGAIIGAMVLGAGAACIESGHYGPVILPLVIAAGGIVCSILGTFVVRTKEGGNPQLALDAGSFGSAAVMAVATFALARQFWPTNGTRARRQAGHLVRRGHRHRDRARDRRRRGHHHQLLLLDRQSAR